MHQVNNPFLLLLGRSIRFLDNNTSPASAIEIQLLLGDMERLQISGFFFMLIGFHLGIYKG
jgi:hypothetical protein